MKLMDFMKTTAFSLVIILISGCCSSPPPHIPIELPHRPVLGEYSDSLWFQLPQEAREIIVGDDLATKQYIRRVEERVRIHNGDVND